VLVNDEDRGHNGQHVRVHRLTKPSKSSFSCSRPVNNKRTSLIDACTELTWQNSRCTGSTVTTEEHMNGIEQYFEFGAAVLVLFGSRCVRKGYSRALATPEPPPLPYKQNCVLRTMCNHLTCIDLRCLQVCKGLMDPAESKGGACINAGTIRFAVGQFT
jgi:hypothetical protein